MEKLRVPVKSLVEHSMRRGDLSRDLFDSGSPLEGIRIHRHLQSHRPPCYQKEVTLSHTTEMDGFELEIQGRVDGIFDSGERIVVEEIKTTRRDLAELREDENSLHWAQLKVYAFLVAVDRGLESVETQLTYCRQGSLETLELKRTFSKPDLAAFFRGLVVAYGQWARKLKDWIRTRDRGIENLEFPFKEYRKGQREMAVAIYRTVEDGAQALIQAPTGIGKTMAAIFPAVKSLNSASAGRIYYLTAKTTGQATAESTIALLRDRGLRVKSLTLTAKDRICFNPGSTCNGEECEFARGFYDRLGDALSGLFEFDSLDRPTIEYLARRHQVCPFELSLELSGWADVVIGDYNYVFDPRVSLRRLFADTPGSGALLVDEAHNLLERAREMYSSQLQGRPFARVAAILKKSHPSLARVAARVARWFAKTGESHSFIGIPAVEPVKPIALEKLLREFSNEVQRWVTQPESRLCTDREAILELFFEVVGFLRVGEQYDSAYATCYLGENGDFTVKLFCLDPSRQLKSVLRSFRCSVLFSATLAPAEFYGRCLGCCDSVRSISFPSPFPKEHLRVLVADRVSTRYHQRSKSRETVTGLLLEFASMRPGNYLFFFPSYRYLQMVFESFSCRKGESVRTVVQAGGMSLGEREAFLDRFQPDPRESLAGFAVMGGLFGEGIDLVGDRLTGVAVVGVGLPSVSLERELIRGYFTELGEDGFDFSYRFPGMTRVTQSAGRLIRSEKDRGVVLLVDQRFSTPGYRALFPAGWRWARISTVDRLRAELQSFWGDPAVPTVSGGLYENRA